MDAALERGWTFLDTAEAYRDSEERLGRILKGRRDRVFLATKAFPCESFSFEHLGAALEASLRRLQTDRVDLYRLHGPENWVAPFGPTRIDELAASLDRLRDSGKALRIGVCNFGAGALAESASRAEVFSTQNLYSLLDPGEEDDAAHLPAVGRILPPGTSRASTSTSRTSRGGPPHGSPTTVGRSRSSPWHGRCSTLPSRRP